MENYMIDIDLPPFFDEDFVKLIPHQRKFVDNMVKKGVIVNYSLSLDRSKLWLVVSAKNVHDVKNIIGSFPIFNFIKFKIYDLLFHETSFNTVPHLWLN
jgi:hypothetical protein